MGALYGAPILFSASFFRFDFRVFSASMQAGTVSCGESNFLPRRKLSSGCCPARALLMYDVRSMATERRIRVLVAKPGMDGHDRGVKVIARALRDAGMEVIYTGLRQTPEMIVNASLQEDVDVIGLSILSGAHNSIVPRVMELLKQNEMSDVLVLVGGIIPEQDVASLKQSGVAAVFQPGTPMEDIVRFIRQNLRTRGVGA